jgi:fatty acid desaturase
MAEMPGQKKGKQMTKFLFAVAAFFGLYVFAGWVGSILPAWVGASLILAVVAGLIALIVMIGKVYR